MYVDDFSCDALHVKHARASNGPMYVNQYLVLHATGAL